MDSPNKTVAQVDITVLLGMLRERGIEVSPTLAALAGLPQPLNPRAAEAMQMAFEAMGGLPRLLLWADAHPAQFYKLFARMIPPTIAPVLPDSATEAPSAPEWASPQRLSYRDTQQATPVEDQNQEDGH